MLQLDDKSDCMCNAGKEAVTQGRNSLAAKLAASPVWLSLTLDADTFPNTARQVLQPFQLPLHSVLEQKI